MPPTPAPRENQVFFWAHSLLLCVVLIGFGRSFFLRPLFLQSPLPSLLMLHGAALTLWFALTVQQAWAARTRRTSWHARAAWLAVPVLIGVVVSGFWVNTALALQITSDQDPENMFVWANYMSLLSYVVLVALAVAKRRQLAAHRRLMLFASIAIIGPAFARFAFWPVFGLGKLSLVLAPAFAVAGMLALVVIALGYDIVTLRRPQPATWGGLLGILLPLVAGTAVALSGAGFALLH
ncbi:MAG: hypothetical protein HY020_04105 [Burkholderiales bacterium]|nr:hypothetical protein [Burkholderiales bacterium]